MSAYKKLSFKLLQKQPLSISETRVFLTDKTLTSAQKAILLTLLQSKGFDSKEFLRFARELQTKRKNVSLPGAVDVSGTGGSGLPRVNTSTIAAFILAALGIPVAKHGNRASSGRFGSFDLLEALGIEIIQKPEHYQYLFFKENLAFLFAPYFYPTAGQFKEARKMLPFPTIFNLMGPLINPCEPSVQLVGTSYREYMDLLADSAIEMGKKHVLIVRGEDGLDEVTLSGATEVVEIQSGKKTKSIIKPEDFGLRTVPKEKIFAASKDEKIRITLDILKGESSSAHRDLVLANAAVVLKMLGKTPTLKEGYMEASRLLKSGKAYDKYLSYKRCNYSGIRRK